MVSSWILWHEFPETSGFPLLLPIKNKQRKERGHLETPAHCVDTPKKTEVGKGSQQLTNGYHVPGSLLDALGTSSHVIFTTILGGGRCLCFQKMKTMQLFQVTQ